ncbi:neurogenic locus notch protein, partial [Homalodisca vitripennis]
RNEQIEEASYSGIILPSAEWHTLNHLGSTARITYRVRVQCDLNYYNSTCTKFCRPRNDKFGHYNCDRNGDKECITGWKGANCEIAVCKTGCHPNHGKCDNPGDCDHQFYLAMTYVRSAIPIRALVPNCLPDIGSREDNWEQ